MFKIRGIVTSRRKDYGDTVADSHIGHHLTQKIGIAAVFGDGVVGKSLRRNFPRDFACYHRITCAARYSEVVFQDVPLSVFAFHKVDA